MAMTLQHLARLGAAFILAATAGVATAPSAGAASAPADAVIRGAHFSPTTPGVDVYLGRFDGRRPPTKLWLSKVSYGAVSPYQPLTPGLYTVAMRPAGAAATTRPVLSWTLDAKPHAAYTVAGVGAGAAVRGVVVKDNLSAPPAGCGRVRVIQAASRAPVASVTATGGRVITRGVPFASVSSYATLPVGTWTVRARATSDPTVSATGPVTVRNGQVTSILLLDGKSSGITLRTVVDSASVGVMPAHAVPAGGGGTARIVVNDDPGSAITTPALLAGVGLAVLIGALGTRRRRRSSRR